MGAAFSAGSLLFTGWILWLLLRPAERASELGRVDDQTLLAADEALQCAPSRFTLGLCGGVAGAYGLATAWVWLLKPEIAPIGPPELGAVALYLIAILTGSSTFAFPVLNMLITNQRVDLSRAMAERGLTSRAPNVSLGPRLGALTFPEIPCSFDDDQLSEAEYVDASVLDGVSAVHFFTSAMLARAQD